MTAMLFSNFGMGGKFDSSCRHLEGDIYVHLQPLSSGKVITPKFASTPIVFFHASILQYVDVIAPPLLSACH